MVLATSVVDDAVAWLGLPAVFVVTSLGLGLLVERLLRLRLPAAALLPLGACASMCVLLAIYRAGGHGWLAGGVLVALTVAGAVAGRHGLAARLRPGPATAAGTAVAALYLAPAVLSGHWTWFGYNFLNDTAVQFLLADQLMHNGVELVQGGPSTRSLTIQTYIETGYPLGSHAHVATFGWLLGSGVDVVYQGYLAMLAVTAAVALTALARRSGLGPWAAAAAAGVALAASLIYQYALQGSIKELAACAAIVTMAMLGRELLATDRPVQMAAAVALAAAAAVSAFSTAAGPYVVILGLALAGGAFLVSGSPLRARLPAVAVVGVAVGAVAAVPTLLSAFTFVDVANESLAASSTTSSVLGQLARPLPAVQVAGVWINAEYSHPIGVAWRETLTTAGIALVLALALASVVVFGRRREPGPLLLLVTTLVTAAVVAPRTSPYADAKLLAIASPAVVFAAACVVLTARGRWRLPGLAAGAAMSLLVIASAAWAYHGVRLAPVARLQGLEDVMDHVADRGTIMLDEVEEFGKYYGRRAPLLNVAFEPITPRQAQPFGGGYHLDLDQLVPEYVRQFDVIVTRRGADPSRPPADYRLVYENRWYQAWEKDRDVRVLAHLPLQGSLEAGAVPDCDQVRGLARQARQSGGMLVAATAPETRQLRVVDAPDRPFGWPPLPAPPGVVFAATPGMVERAVRVDGGVYDVWLRATTGRRTYLSIDGRRVATVQGINTQGQWLSGGRVELAPGRHELRIERPGGSLEPGDGALSQIGPLALVRRERRTLRRFSPADAARLCDRTWDWVEVVAP